MLSKPLYGWTDFQLEGTSVYGLSYLDDIAFEWMDQAIRGLETLRPFCVAGFLEPHRMLCTVSYWNCHIVEEYDGRRPLKEGDLVNEYSHTSMLEFCKFLYEDVSRCIDEWASFVDYCEEDLEEKKRRLRQKLQRLKELIAEKEENFGENRCFL